MFPKKSQALFVAVEYSGVNEQVLPVTKLHPLALPQYKGTAIAELTLAYQLVSFKAAISKIVKNL